MDFHLHLKPYDFGPISLGSVDVHVNLFVLGSIAFGSTLLYILKGPKGVRPYLLPALTDFIPSGRVRNLADLVFFVLVGCVVSFIMAGPDSVRQGFAAGLGWTGMLTETLKKK